MSPPISLTPEQLQELVANAVRAVVEPKAEFCSTPDQLTDNFIADVVDDAFRKGIQMRQVHRVDGPFAHGNKFRLRIVEAGGARKYLSYASEAEATKAKRVFEREADRESGPTIDSLITDYESFQKLAGKKELAIITTCQRLRCFFTGTLNDKVGYVTEARLAGLLEELNTRPGRLRRPLAIDTRKNIVAEVKTFGRWLADKGAIKSGAFDSLKVPGRRKRGKPHLRFDERERWYAKALELASGGDEAALGALLALDGNLRSSEVWKRIVRDVDRGGSVVWVTDAKTQAGNRTVDLSPEVAKLLAKHVQGRRPEEPLFPSAAELSDPKMWLARVTERICKLAGVPRVTPHGLRGTGADRDLMRNLVRTVAEKLGHADKGETALNHYLSPDVVSAVERALSRALSGQQLGTN